MYLQCVVNRCPAFKELENKINLLTNTVPSRSTLLECSAVLPVADRGFIDDDNTIEAWWCTSCSIDTIRASFAYVSYERSIACINLYRMHTYLWESNNSWLSIALYPKQFQIVINSHRFQLHIVPDATTWPSMRWLAFKIHSPLLVNVLQCRWASFSNFSGTLCALRTLTYTSSELYL